MDVIEALALVRTVANHKRPFLPYKLTGMPLPNRQPFPILPSIAEYCASFRMKFRPWRRTPASTTLEHYETLWVSLAAALALGLYARSILAYNVVNASTHPLRRRRVRA